MKITLILLLQIIFLNLKAQDSTKTSYTSAIDISPFALSGYSLKTSAIFKNKNEIAVEYFSMEIPEMVINLNSKNEGKGWSERVNNGVAVYLDKKLSSNRNGFWAGAGFVFLNHTATNQTQKFNYNQLEYLLRLNYKWYPFENSGFYINPYLAIAARHKIAGENGDYALTPALLIPSVYLSWEFH